MDDEPVEYWCDNDSDLEADFSQRDPPLPNLTSPAKADDLTLQEQAILWGLVLFTCMFQTLHKVSLKATEWLLTVLKGLLTLLGKLYSPRIALVGEASLHRRKQFIENELLIPSLHNYVVCKQCHSLYEYSQCLKKQGSKFVTEFCANCRNNSPLMRIIVTSRGNQKFYPIRVYSYASLLSCLKPLFRRPGFLVECENWRTMGNQKIKDVFQGRIWKQFLEVDGKPFLREPNSIVLMLNVDWFQSFKHREYSVGVIYLSIMNLPLTLRYKRENIIIVGTLQGPFEPSKDINHYIQPLVQELLVLWNGVEVETADKGVQHIRCALLYVCCDLPASKKVCGFLSHSANLGCSKCFSEFSTGVFGVQDYSGFERSQWRPRTNQKHREDAEATRLVHTKTGRAKKESELGCRYSCLLELPYFDPVKMLAIDPMHNLYIGTAKHIFLKIWLKRNLLDTCSISVINNRIRSLNKPSEVSFGKLPATMEHSRQFTAEQWLSWVNYYSLYCLHNLLPADHIECWRHFVLASRLLCKHELSTDDIQVADCLLVRFCKKFKQLYTPSAVTPNIHLHAHLAEGILDFGPISTFWLFSFERFNGLLGEEPTNNRSIEIQMLQRFINDNSHFQMLSLLQTHPIGKTMLCKDAIEHCVNRFASTKHLDQHHCLTEREKFLPDKKYSLFCLDDDQLDVLRSVYGELYGALAVNLTIPETCQRMRYVTWRGCKLKSGQYYLTKCNTPFPGLGSIQSIFNDPNVRPALVEYFFA